MRGVLSLLVVVPLLGCAGQSPTSEIPVRPEFMTHEELRALMSEDRTILFSNPPYRGKGAFGKDGTASLDGGTWQVYGAWRIEGNRFCTEYPGARAFTRACYYMEKTGDKTYKQFPIDGSQGSTWEVQK